MKFVIINPNKDIGMAPKVTPEKIVKEIPEEVSETTTEVKKRKPRTKKETIMEE